MRRLLQALDGTQTEYEDEILRFVPQQILALKSRSAGDTITWVYQLDALVEGRTNVTLRVVKSASGLERFMAPLSDDASLMQVEVDIRKLKEVVEGNRFGGSSSDDFGSSTKFPQ